jgi:hypothetical protein
MNNNSFVSSQYGYIPQKTQMAHRQWLAETFNFLMKNPTKFQLMNYLNIPRQYYIMFDLYIKFYCDILNLCKNEYLVAINFWRIHNIKIQNIVYIVCLKHNITFKDDDSAFNILLIILNKKHVVDDQGFIEMVNGFMNDVMILQKSMMLQIEPAAIKHYAISTPFDDLIMSMVSNVLDEDIVYDVKLVTCIE